MLTLIAFGRRCELIVKLAEPKLVVTITNVTTGSGATVSVFALLSSPGPALRSAVSLRVLPAAEPMPCVLASTAPPTLPRLILGLQRLVCTVSVLVRSERGVACVLN